MARRGAVVGGLESGTSRGCLLVGASGIPLGIGDFGLAEDGAEGADGQGPTAVFGDDDLKAAFVVRHLRWLPRWETRWKPCWSKIASTCAAVSRGIRGLIPR